jgi:hypothetical protein
MSIPIHKTYLVVLMKEQFDIDDLGNPYSSSHYSWLFRNIPTIHQMCHHYSLHLPQMMQIPQNCAFIPPSGAHSCRGAL